MAISITPVEQIERTYTFQQIIILALDFSGETKVSLSLHEVIFSNTCHFKCNCQD